MRVLRPSSIQEYASWYLHREARKGDAHPIPTEPEQQVQGMRQRHAGKLRAWFSATTRWQIVELNVADLGALVFMECTWTIAEGLLVRGGLNYRLLDRVAANAMAGGYLARPLAHQHKAYYDRLGGGTLQLTSEDRIAICSAEPNEIASNPAARYYLLDGVGRCLPYMILVKEQKLESAPVEAFLAERAAV